MAVTTYENRSRFTQRLQSRGSKNTTSGGDPSRRSAGWYIHHFIGSAFQLGAMATTYYASRTEPLNWDAHTNISWALLFIAIIVIPSLLTFVESFVEPDGSGQDVVAGVTIMLALGGIIHDGGPRGYPNRDNTGTVLDPAAGKPRAHSHCPMQPAREQPSSRQYVHGNSLRSVEFSLGGSGGLPHSVDHQASQLTTITPAIDGSHGYHWTNDGDAVVAEHPGTEPIDALQHVRGEDFRG